MPFKKIVKNLLEFKHIVIDNRSVDGEKLLVDVHPAKSFRNRCGCCGHKGTFYDYGTGLRLWRSVGEGKPEASGSVFATNRRSF